MFFSLETPDLHQVLISKESLFLFVGEFDTCLVLSLSIDHGCLILFIDLLHLIVIEKVLSGFESLDESNLEVWLRNPFIQSYLKECGFISRYQEMRHFNQRHIQVLVLAFLSFAYSSFAPWVVFFLPQVVQPLLPIFLILLIFLSQVTSFLLLQAFLKVI